MGSSRDERKYTTRSKKERDYNTEIALGLRPRIKGLRKYGKNDDIDIISTPEDIWSPGTEWVAPTAPCIHDVVSSLAADTQTTGTGAWNIKIYGLDANWLEQTEILSLNGLTVVPTAKTYVRIFRMHLVDSGVDDTNAGLITATAQSGGTVTAEIPIGKGQTLMAIFTTAANQRLLIKSLGASMLRDGSAGKPMAELELRVRESADLLTSSWRTRDTVSPAGLGTSQPNREYKYPIIAGPKSDIIVKCVSANDNNLVIDANFTGELEFI